MIVEWLEPQGVEVPEALRQMVGGHPLVAEALVRRGVVNAAQAQGFLDPAHYHARPPADLPGLAAAVARLAQAVARGERILVWGDFDVDGLTSTAILVENLRAQGAVTAHYVPSRAAGHGVDLATMQRFLTGANTPQLVLTCDTGVGATTAAAYARGLGVDMVITDHHALPPELPAARAIVNPCFLPADHPLRTLPGAGCAYLLAAALSAELGGGAGEGSLDLMALAIVADVATLQGDVRYYLQRGLTTLRQSERLGLQAICETAGLAPEGLNEDHLGFALAPRLNALGRLGDPSAGLEILLTTDLTRARTIAAEMEGLNSRRQLLTSQVLQAAEEQLGRDQAAQRAPVLIVAHPTWPPGINGLVAGRLAERYGKPAVALATPAHGLARGSARSVPGIDIAAAIASVSDLLVSHGGHPAAAGLALRPEALPEFRQRLQAEVGRRAALAPPLPPLAIDGYLQLAEAGPELARDLGRLSPFGPGHPPIVLAVRRLRVVGQAAVGRSGEHRRLYVKDQAGCQQKVFWWQSAGQPVPEGVFDLALTMRPNNYQGRDEVTLEWVAARVVEPATAIPAVSVATPRYEVFDHRDDLAAAKTLEAVCALAPCVVWAEAAQPQVPGVVDRLTASPAATMVLWTAPPGPLELARLLAQVQPRRVHLFAMDPAMDAPELLMRRLAGLVKHVLAQHNGVLGQALLERMAAATAQRVSTVRWALRWLEAQGQLVLAGERDGPWQVSPAAGLGNPAAAHAAAAKLGQLLGETAAYRSYVRRADPHVLLAAAPACHEGVGHVPPTLPGAFR